MPDGRRVLFGLVLLYADISTGECGVEYGATDVCASTTADEGDGDIGLSVAGDIRGVVDIEIDGDGGGGSDIGVDGDDIECLAEPLRLCFLYFTCGQ
jgi:hypothetical protein